MHVKVIRQNVDDDERQFLLIDGKKVLCVASFSESPEDAYIGRGLVSCDDIAAFMQRAVDACHRGEDVTFETVIDDSYEW